jgi:hypothetical protein
MSEEITVVYCGDCGIQNPDGKRFCWKCGAGDDDAKSDILFDIIPSNYEIANIASFLLPALVKWVWTHARIQESHRLFFGGLFMLGYENRWTKSEFEQGPKWLQDIIRAARNMTRRQ